MNVLVRLILQALALPAALYSLGLPAVHAAGNTAGLAGAEQVLRDATVGNDAQAAQHRYATLIVLSAAARRITTLGGARPQPDDVTLITEYRTAMQELLREAAAAGPTQCQGEQCPAQQLSRRALALARSPGFAQKVLERFSTPAWQRAHMAAVLARASADVPDAGGSAQDAQAAAATMPAAAPPSAHSPGNRPGPAPDTEVPVSGTPGRAQAQTPGAAGRSKDIDLVDIRLGMSEKEAAEALAKRYPSAERTIVKGRLNIPGGEQFTTALLAIDRKPMPNGRDHGEVVLVLLSTPPSAPEVIHVARAVFHARGQPSHRDEWLRALSGKYGPPTMSHGRNVDSWMFDTVRARDPRASKEHLVGSCIAHSIFRSIPFGDGLGHYVVQLKETLKPATTQTPSEVLQSAALSNEEKIAHCGRSLSVAFSQAGGGPLIDALVFDLSDFDRSAAAGRKLEAMRSGAARQEAERESGRARQNKPTL